MLLPGEEAGALVSCAVEHRSLMPTSKRQEMRTVINTFSQSPRAEQIKTSAFIIPSATPSHKQAFPFEATCLCAEISVSVLKDLQFSGKNANGSRKQATQNHFSLLGNLIQEKSLPESGLWMGPQARRSRDPE